LRGNCLLKHVIEGKREVMGRRGRRRKKILDDIKETKGSLKLKEGYRMALLIEALSYKPESRGFDSR
jgi:hypothetical protein